jgi:hypothetical protein
MFRTNYIVDCAIAEIFEEEVDRDFPSHDEMPYDAASFLTSDSCSDSEEEAFCYSCFSDSSRG